MKYYPLTAILPPFPKGHTEEKSLKMIPKRYTKTPICVHQIETEKGAGYGKNEQQAAAGMVFLLK
ncbi:hypothetical protein NIA69_17235 [Gemmiger formicilis]|nr:hypothetical protein [Gemmiger formicilis]